MTDSDYTIWEEATPGTGVPAPPVNQQNLQRQMAALLAHERTFQPGEKTAYENGAEKMR
jgi:hypothetical protein